MLAALILLFRRLHSLRHLKMQNQSLLSLPTLLANKLLIQSRSPVIRVTVGTHRLDDQNGFNIKIIGINTLASTQLIRLVAKIQANFLRQRPTP